MSIGKNYPFFFFISATQFMLGKEIEAKKIVREKITMSKKKIHVAAALRQDSLTC